MNPRAFYRDSAKRSVGIETGLGRLESRALVNSRLILCHMRAYIAIVLQILCARVLFMSYTLIAARSRARASTRLDFIWRIV